MKEIYTFLKRTCVRCESVILPHASESRIRFGSILHFLSGDFRSVCNIYFSHRCHLNFPWLPRWTSLRRKFEPISI